ncbi:MAG TPA: DNA alkylation repair protein [Bacteroidia bacterium]|nr:DNA alkylation repair protein [Bacteroidia bacterium]
MEALKHMFNPGFARLFGANLKAVYDEFPEQTYLNRILPVLGDLELNQRLSLFAEALHGILPESYNKSLSILKKAAPLTPQGYTNLIYPAYVAKFGLMEINASLEALKYFTRYGSSEFAIREFIRTDPEKCLSVMKEWTSDENEHVRRLASEGSRPRLPWSFKLDFLIQNPVKGLAILDRLKTDPSPYVRRSVANHLNDVSKDNPEEMLKFLRTWKLTDPQSAWIMKHGCRSLIKKGHPGALAFFSFQSNTKLKLDKFRLSSSSLKLGQHLEFSFQLKSSSPRTQKLVVDYAILYCRKSGQNARKVFKLKTLDLPGNASMLFSKKQIIKDFSTRKHLSGKHTLEIQVNGRILCSRHFFLNADQA